MPQWDMDSVITHNATEAIEMGGRFEAQKLRIDASEVALSGEGTISAAGRRLLIDRTQAQGMDTVVLIERTVVPNGRVVPSGFGLYRQTLLGHGRAYLLAAIAVAVFRVDGNSVLAQSSPDPLTPMSLPWPNPSSWQEMSREQQEELERTIKQNVFDQVAKTIVALGLTQ